MRGDVSELHFRQRLSLVTATARRSAPCLLLVPAPLSTATAAQLNQVRPLSRVPAARAIVLTPISRTVSSLQYFNEAGAGTKHSDMCHYSQAVIVGDVVKCAGQGGWDNSGALNGDDYAGQVRNAFDNVERVLAAAGVSAGWEAVYSLRSYVVGPSGETFQPLVDELKKRTPNHRPIWTALTVPELAFPGMRVELEVEAYRA